MQCYKRTDRWIWPVHLLSWLAPGHNALDILPKSEKKQECNTQSREGDKGRMKRCCSCKAEEVESDCQQPFAISITPEDELQGTCGQSPFMGRALLTACRHSLCNSTPASEPLGLQGSSWRKDELLWHRLSQEGRCCGE